MKTEEVREVIKHVSELWPEWEASDAEIEVWIDKLKYFQKHEAIDSVNEYFSQQTISYKRPVLGSIIAKVNLRRTSGAYRAGQPMLLCVIECSDNDDEFIRRLKFPIYTNRDYEENVDIDTLRLNTAEKIKQVYGGRWAIVTPDVVAERRTEMFNQMKEAGALRNRKDIAASIEIWKTLQTVTADDIIDDDIPF